MSAFPKENTYSSEKYKAYIRTLPCIVCGGDAEPHHEISGGTVKGPDLFCIPLCREHHNERHSIGVATFWSLRPKSKWQTIAECLSKYIANLGD